MSFLKLEINPYTLKINSRINMCGNKELKISITIDKKKPVPGRRDRYMNQ